MRTKGSPLSGRASSGKIASTGHSGSHAPQSMHSSGSMIKIRSNSWMQSTGQTSTQERSLMSIQGSEMMYVISSEPSNEARGAISSSVDAHELVHNLARAVDERGLHDHLVEARGVRAPHTPRVRVVREPEDRRVRPRARHVVGVDP